MENKIENFHNELQKAEPQNNIGVQKKNGDDNVKVAVIKLIETLIKEIGACYRSSHGSKNRSDPPKAA